MPIARNRRSSLATSASSKTAAPTKTSMLDRPIGQAVNKTIYAFAKIKVVPPNRYNSKIVAMELATTKAGAEAIDALYDLTASDGSKYHVRMRYPDGSFFLEEFLEALRAAGLPANAKLSDAVGIQEVVELDYVNDESIGTFINRWPVGKVPVNRRTSGSANSGNLINEDEDDEFSDFLDEADEEDEDE